MQRNRFIDLLPHRAKILEVGAGHRRDVAHFLNFGFRVTVTEPSVGLARIAVETTQADVFLLQLKRALRVGGTLHASFLRGVGTDDSPERIADGRYFNRVSESAFCLHGDTTLNYKQRTFMGTIAAAATQP